MSPLQPYVPEDFDAFWEETAREARAAPLDFHRELRAEFETPTHRIERIDFRGSAGQTLHGWMAIPEGARRRKSFLWLPPYGWESSQPDEFSTRPDYVSMSFNFFGKGAFHKEPYRAPNGYFAQGIEDPKTWVFRRLFQDAWIACRVLQAQLEADEDRIAVAGLSQGGGMAIWLGAHCPIVKAVCADLPFLCAIVDTLSRPVHRYPLKEIVDFATSVPLGMERVRHTVAYFDTMNQATRCRVPTQVGLGLRDPAVRPVCVWGAFQALAGPKALVEYDIGHDWHPAMIANNATFLNRVFEERPSKETAGNTPRVGGV